MSATRLPTDMLRAGLIYGTGDSVAALLTTDFSWHRCVGMTLIGAMLLRRGTGNQQLPFRKLGSAHR